jgi:glycosyltransferase involved in cell wall biosynthesis
MRNEGAVLTQLLDHLAHWRDRGCEIVIVDGASTDGSAEIARAEGFKVLDAPPGRARQMNAGASATLAPILMFLHADTRLPPEADQMALGAVSGRHVWGRFDVTIEGRPLMLRVIGTMINLRSRVTAIATGDQAIFVRRDRFDELGGFAELPLMEDIELSRRLRVISRPACLAAKARTSGRRWETYGVWRTIFLMWFLRQAYWLGVAPDKLAARYR